MPETWSYYAANVIKIADGDYRSKYWENQFIKITQTTDKYFVITDVTYTNPHTYLTVWGGGQYTLVDASITAHSFSLFAAPSGIPVEFETKPFRGMQFVLDGNGVAIVTGYKMDLFVGFAGRIKGWTAVAQPISGQSSCSITIDLWRTTYSSFAYNSHPVDADSITASAPISISSAVKNTNTTLTGWTKDLAKNDVIRVNVDSCTNCRVVTVFLDIGVP